MIHTSHKGYQTQLEPSASMSPRINCLIYDFHSYRHLFCFTRLTGKLEVSGMQTGWYKLRIILL